MPLLWNTRRRPAQPPDHRLRSLVREVRDRPPSPPADEGDAPGEELDVMGLLVELRAAAKRGSDPAAARKLGREFIRYLGQFYALPAEEQPQVIEALLEGGRREQRDDLEGAVQACEAGLRACPGFMPLLERLARLETARGRSQSAEQWYNRLLSELERHDLHGRGLEICRRLLETEVDSFELLEQCGRILEAADDLPLAANCWSRRAAKLQADGHLSEALVELDRALNLQPDSPHLNLELALLYERMEEPDRAATAFERAAGLASDDADTFARILLIRSRLNRPEEDALGHLMDLLESRPLARATALQRCAEAVEESPYNPHLRYIQGVLLAQDGQVDRGVAALRIAVDRYSAQSDRTSELEARLALQQLDTRDEANFRRVAALYFERGEVHLAMQALAELARASRGIRG